MRTSRVAGSAACALLVAAAACASSGVAPVATTPGASPATTHADAKAFRDSVIAQAVADARGPDVSINAYFDQFADNRYVQGWFRPVDDAYVVIGHLGADGVLRIVFPQPGDDGFVKGGHTYYLPRFFAGFTSEYRTRFAMSSYAMPYPRAHWQSYDGGMGYLFAIAAWRPMQLDQMQDRAGWDTWELADDEYFRDPRPAINELASLLVGVNREAYTVKYARYMGTASYTSLLTMNLGYNALWPYGSAFAAQWCSGFEPLGYAFGAPYLPWLRSAFPYGGYANGFNYAYDNRYGCYRATYPAPISIASIPVVPTPVQPRFRQPADPAVRHPQPGQVGQPLTTRIAAPTKSATSLEGHYRARGLFMMDDDDSRPSGRRGGKRAMDSDASTASRPSIQQMVNTPRDEGGYRRQPADASTRMSPRATTPRAYEPRAIMPGASSDPGAASAARGANSGGSSGASSSSNSGARAKPTGGAGSEPMASPRGQPPRD